MKLIMHLIEKNMDLSVLLNKYIPHTPDIKVPATNNPIIENVLEFKTHKIFDVSVILGENGALIIAPKFAMKKIERFV